MTYLICHHLKTNVIRKNVGKYVIKVRELGLRILELISEGLGLEPKYFANELSGWQVMSIHHYPPCPDPSLALGTRKHGDTGLVTILLQDHVPGLQVLKDGEWIGVEAIPDAFVINIGYQLQVYIFFCFHNHIYTLSPVNSVTQHSKSFHF